MVEQKLPGRQRDEICVQVHRVWTSLEVKNVDPVFISNVLLHPLNASVIHNPTSLCEDILTEAHELGRIEDGLNFCCCPATGPILTLEVSLGDVKLIVHMTLGSSCSLGTFTEVLLD